MARVLPAAMLAFMVSLLLALARTAPPFQQIDFARAGVATCNTGKSSLTSSVLPVGRGAIVAR